MIERLRCVEIKPDPPVRMGEHSIDEEQAKR
jgi:hypothetical protein